MKVRKGDQVVVISGNQRGQTGAVLEVLPGQGRVVVEGINVRIKHLKKTNTKNAGIEKEPRPIDSSNVALIRPGSKNKPTRVGFNINKAGVKTRVATQAAGKEIK